MIIVALGANLPADLSKRIIMFSEVAKTFKQLGITPTAYSKLYLTPALRPAKLKSKTIQNTPDTSTLQLLDSQINAHGNLSSTDNKADRTTGSEFYLNACMAIRSNISASSLLKLFKKIEKQLGRINSNKRWQDRIIDLDIIDYKSMIANQPAVSGGKIRFQLPHPSIASRAFVMLPLLDIAANWHHPISKKSAQQLLRTWDFRNNNQKWIDPPNNYLNEPLNISPKEGSNNFDFEAVNKHFGMLRLSSNLWDTQLNNNSNSNI